MQPDEVESYLATTNSVEGWFFPVDAHLFAFVDELQRREGIAGSLFEIGVHHGKTAIFLARMARPDELIGVCDVFEQQELNRDHSGEGSRELFLANFRAHAGRDEVRVFAKPSSSLTVADTTKGCRFFHIDGGHRPEDVFGDLATADAALLPEGVVAVDDLFNANWPGVSEGFYRFAASRPESFAPLLVGGNKVLLTRPATLPRYDRHLDELRTFAASQPFDWQRKRWLGREVMTAVRRAWVDLDPIAAARLHLPPGGWRERLLRILGMGHRR